MRELHQGVTQALANLKLAMSHHMPDVEHAQVTFDNLRDESPPTVDVIRTPATDDPWTCECDDVQRKYEHCPNCDLHVGPPGQRDRCPLCKEEL